MKQYSFATMVTIKNDIPIATQLPFFVDDSLPGKIILRSHLAVANEQAGYIEANTSLVIFSEPHAYISPSHYDRRESVPTWNYIVVHAYGKARIIHHEQSKMELLAQTISFYEKDYLAQWNILPEKFKSGMLKGIVAFELEVTDLPGQKKLSQNKTEAERERIIKHLEASGNTAEREIAARMKDEG